MENSHRPTATGMLAARQASQSSFAFGIALTILGVFAVMAPLFTGVTTTVLIGLLLLGGGVFEAIYAFQAKSFGKGVLRFLFGALGIVAGIVVIATPGESLGVLAWLLAAFFVASGIVDVALAFSRRSDEGWLWMLFSGVLAITVGVLIVAQWPASGIWAVGLYVGIRLLTHGWALVALGQSGKEAITHLQDSRLAMLEDHVRAGAQALLETQALLADHTAALLALDNELRKKVSASDVDPALQGLNEKLGAARERMQAVEAATKESWPEAQSAAAHAFDVLRRNVFTATNELKRDLQADQESGTAS